MSPLYIVSTVNVHGSEEQLVKMTSYTFCASFLDNNACLMAIYKGSKRLFLHIIIRLKKREGTVFSKSSQNISCKWFIDLWFMSNFDPIWKRQMKHHVSKVSANLHEQQIVSI